MVNDRGDASDRATNKLCTCTGDGIINPTNTAIDKVMYLPPVSRSASSSTVL